MFVFGVLYAAAWHVWAGFLGGYVAAGCFGLLWLAVHLAVRYSERKWRS